MALLLTTFVLGNGGISSLTITGTTAKVACLVSRGSHVPCRSHPLTLFPFCVMSGKCPDHNALLPNLTSIHQSPSLIPTRYWRKMEVRSGTQGMPRATPGSLSMHYMIKNVWLEKEALDPPPSRVYWLLSLTTTSPKHLTLVGKASTCTEQKGDIVWLLEAEIPVPLPGPGQHSTLSLRLCTCEQQGLIFHRAGS